MTTETQDSLECEARKVRLDELHLDTDTFQFRWEDLTESQVAELRDALKRRKELDPITVWERPEDGRLFVVDGHHRYEAYRRSGSSVLVPVLVHRGDKKTAVLLALKENTKTRLVMTQPERLNAAWHLECSDDEYSKAEIVDAAGVGNGTVANMRRVKRKLQEAGEDLQVGWEDAKRIAAGRERDWTDADRDAWREEALAKLREQIARAVVQYAQKDPTVPLEVLHDVMGEDRFRQGAEWLLYFEGEEDPYTGAVTLKLNKELELDTPF